MGGTILAMFIMRNYSITEEKAKGTKAALAEKRK
jgi:hypothetical protein